MTERAGRPVLAIRASARGAVPGIVHDSSGLGSDAVRRAVRRRRATRTGSARRRAPSARRSRASCASSRGGRRPRRRAVGAGGRRRGDRPRARARGPLAAVAGRPGDIWPRGRPTRRAAPAARPATAVPIDLELGDLRAVVISGPNTGGKTVALKTLGLAALLHQCGLRPPADEAALPGVRPDPRRHRRRAVDRDEPLDVLRPHPQPRRDPRRGHRPLARPARRGRRRDRSGRGRGARSGAARAARQSGTAHGRDEPLSRAQGVGKRDRGRDERSHGVRPGVGEPLYRITLGRPGTSHALRIAERLGLAPDLVAEARAELAPERLRVAELLAEAEAAEERAAEDRESAASARAAAESSRDAAEDRVAELEQEIERGASGRAERERALAEAEKELAEDQRRSSARFERRSAQHDGWSASATARRLRPRSRRSASETGGSEPRPTARPRSVERCARPRSPCRSPSRSRQAIRSSPPSSASGGRLPRSRGRTQSSSAAAAFACASRSRGSGPIVTRRLTPRRTRR